MNKINALLLFSSLEPIPVMADAHIHTEVLHLYLGMRLLFKIVVF
jgi:hypothetical protein